MGDRQKAYTGKRSEFRNLLTPEESQLIYKVMDVDNMVLSVKAAQTIMRQTGKIPSLGKRAKCEIRFVAHQEVADKAFAKSQYKEAMLHYNMALAFAPSYEYENQIYVRRSGLYYKLKAYKACLKEIKNITWSCVRDMHTKLKRRKKKSEKALWIQKISHLKTEESLCYGNLFVMTAVNPDVQCATEAVHFVNEGLDKKVVAAEDIGVGSLLAVEPAYVSQLNDAHKYLACNFCHKMSLNLMPCIDCCNALFCDSACMGYAQAEYHNMEYALSDLLQKTSTSTQLAFKATMRMLSNSSSWENFISESQTLGHDRFRRNSAYSVYGDQTVALLCFRNDRPVVHSLMYYAAIDCAVILHHWEEQPDNNLPLPPDQRQRSLEAVTKIMMFLTVNHNLTLMPVVVNDNMMETDEFVNHGWYPFISKLRNSCLPNVIALTLDKQIALVAVREIKNGDEITLSHLGYWLDNQMTLQDRRKAMYALSGTFCYCSLCVDGPGKCIPYTLSKEQMAVWATIDYEYMSATLDVEKMPEYLEKAVKCMKALTDLPHSSEYARAYNIFRRCLTYKQTAFCPQNAPRRWAEEDYSSDSDSD